MTHRLQVEVTFLLIQKNTRTAPMMKTRGLVMDPNSGLSKTALRSKSCLL